MPGISVTIARAEPTSALNRLDLPALGRPDDHDHPAFADDAPGPAVRCESIEGVAQPAGVGRRLIARDEMKALVGKIERRLETSRQIEQLRVDARNRLGQRPLELVHRGPRLERGDGVDQIGHRFRLREVDPPGEIGAQGELARLGEPRAGRHRQFDDATNRSGLPCPLISTTSSPVYEWGCANQVTTTWSTGGPCPLNRGRRHA